ncbi:LBP_BPI_CETP domain-containing protein/LBP_BPI_CETP_C domain-containing protein [Cephalotus follicularis]|uniref:LBP_BPI_CETP domain-containing protein/LBP_BPI_CETP_C domain-containing protein n=1 Tax=Cephalotus follicularis TaxID=3775 RepID=A0A1Q3D085_CEPFO|nr:LBP_BPI_CETP domain-containing protein/LBP_BPI_CETP_C domain-containing protein [Cephalotus follicularis]
MGIFSKSMTPTMFFIVLSLFLISTSTHLQSYEEGFISVVMPHKGLDFAKDLLINKAVSSIIPLQLPDIEKSVKIPLVGKVHIFLSNMTIYSVNIGSSYVQTGETGIVLVASNATANMIMNWKYTYSTWLITISDSGGASVKIEGMEVGLTATINEQVGTLKLSVLNCGCDVRDISIKVDGGASWLYQGLVNAFQSNIESAVEGAVSKKIREGLTKLDSLLQRLPKTMQLNSVAALNVTVVDDPVLSDSSVEFELNGLFSTTDDKLTFNHYTKKSQASVFCQSEPKMVVISLHENVFGSGALLYFKENYLHWIVDKIPDLSILNTAEWRDIVPQLYKLYPDDDMNLNISVISPPTIKVVTNDIEATIHTDVTINVLDAGEVISVACISLVINASCSAEILRNNILAGIAKLKDFTLSLNWSKIGDLQMHLLQPILSNVLKTVVLPYVNLHIMRGFPLPLPHGFTLQNAEILSADSKIKVCSDVGFTA